MADEVAGTPPQMGPQTFPVRTLVAEGYRTVHVDGAVTSFTPQGLVMIAIYQEYTGIEPSTETVMYPTGFMRDVPLPPKTPTVCRELHLGMLMSPNIAFALIKSLQEKLHLAGVLENMEATWSAAQGAVDQVAGESHAG